MAAYSLDLRTRVLKDSDAGMVSKLVAEKYAVSRAWVDRLKQRRRETGEIARRALRPEGRVGRGTPSRHQPRDGGSGGAAGANSRATDAQCGGE